MVPGAKVDRDLALLRGRIAPRRLVDVWLSYEDAGGNRGSGRLFDLSTAGLYAVQFGKLPEVGSTLQLNFMLSGAKGATTVQGTVVRVISTRGRAILPL